jgi:phage shock protein A
MGLLSQLFTAFRGGANELGEAIVDTQAIRILEQEVRDAKKHLDEAKENLAKVIAEQMGVERDIKRLKKSIEDYEGYAIQALDKGDDKLAEEIAEKVADLENELIALQSVLEDYNTSINTLKQHIREAERQIKSMEREISVVKTRESVQKANTAAATKFSGSTLRTASDSLERIKRKQQQKADQMTAAMELQREESGGDLQDKLHDAGIVQDKVSSHSVLERIKAKRTDRQNTDN